MKKFIVLPGNSVHNREWGESCVEHFSGWFDEVYMQNYDHWEKESNEIDIQSELAKLQLAVYGEGENYVFAKSIGTILTLLAVHKGLFKPIKCVFFGMPLEIAGAEVFAGDWSPLSNFSVPTLAFHNDGDPISYDYTKQALQKYNPINLKFVTKVGDNHNYTDFSDYENEIGNFLKL